MDFITHLPNSHGHTVIWVICDRLTKFAHFIALPGISQLLTVQTDLQQRFIAFVVSQATTLNAGLSFSTWLSSGITPHGILL